MNDEIEHKLFVGAKFEPTICTSWEVQADKDSQNTRVLSVENSTLN